MRGAIVTGGSRGIGRAIALELSRLGYGVLVNYHSQAEAAAEVAGKIHDAGGMAFTLSGDVGSAHDRQAVVRTAIERFGRLDLLVNNAGITSPGRSDLLEVPESSWDAVFATNLKGPFFLSQLVANEMIREIQTGLIPCGKIINLSSISAYAASSNRADYCLAKAAIEMMTHLFAQRLADEKIAVFEVCPGVIETDMTTPVKAKYDQLIAGGQWPIHRWGKPEDVAKAVAAIVLDYFPYSTGQRFDVDGGFHIRSL